MQDPRACVVGTVRGPITSFGSAHFPGAVDYHNSRCRTMQTWYGRIGILPVFCRDRLEACPTVFVNKQTPPGQFDAYRIAFVRTLDSAPKRCRPISYILYPQSRTLRFAFTEAIYWTRARQTLSAKCKRGTQTVASLALWVSVMSCENCKLWPRAVYTRLHRPAFRSIAWPHQFPTFWTIMQLIGFHRLV